MSVERAVETLTKDYSRFKHSVLRRLDIMQTWEATASAGGGGETNHARLHDINSALDHVFPLAWTNLSKTGSNLTDIQTRRYPDLTERTHNVIGADHSLTAPEYSLVGATADNVLGVLLARGNAQAPGNFDTILRADGSGGLSLMYLNALDYVNTKEIISPLHLALTPTNGGKIHATATMSHPGWVSREFGVAMDFTEGWIDAQSIQAARAHFRYAIIDTTKAYAGDLSITKSVSEVADDFPFTVPATGVTASEPLILDSLPGLDGIDVADDNDNVKLFTFSQEFFSSAHPQLIQTKHFDFSIAAPELQSNSFEGTSIGNMPAAWWESGGGNGTTEITPTRMSVQLDPTDAGNQAFDKNGNVTNGHTHLRSSIGLQNETQGYVVTGRFYLVDDGGIGFTVLSKYSDTGTSIDEYVRIRRTYGGDPFEVANHGSYPSPDAGYGTGTADGTTIPVVSTWYQFKIDVDVQGTYTYVKFKFWEDGQPEPSTWELDVRFSGANRPTTGTAGLWLFSGDYQVDDYIVKERLAYYSASLNMGGEIVRQGDYVMYYLLAAEASASFIFTTSNITASYSGNIIANRIRHVRGFANADTALGGVINVSSNTEQEGALIAVHFRNVDDSNLNVTTYAGSSPYSYTGTGYDEDQYGEAIIYIALDEGGPESTAPTSDTDMSQMALEQGDSGVHWNSSIYYAQVLASDGASQYSGTLTYPGDASNTLIQRYALVGLGTTGELSIGRIWGRIVKDNVTETPDGTQAWTWTTTELNYAGGDVIQPGQAVLIYGKGNVVPTLSDGYIELTTRDTAAVAPYLRMALLPTNPESMPPFVYFQAGAINNLGWTSSKYGVVITKPYASTSDFPNADSTFTPDQYIEISDTKVLMRGIPLQMYDTLNVWKVEIKDTGLMRLGLNLDAANNAQTGFYFDPATGALQIGRDGYTGTVTVVGEIIVENPDTVAAELVNAGDMHDKLINGGWGFLDSPAAGSPAGLYMTGTRMGYWNGSAWATYMDNLGRFSFGVNQRIYYDGTKLYGKNSSNVEQWSVSSTTGILTAGGGDVILWDRGLDIVTENNAFNPSNRVAFLYNGNEYGYVAGSVDNGADFRLILGSQGIGSGPWGTISLRAYAGGDSAFDSGTIGNFANSLDVTPGNTTNSGKGFQVVNYTNFTVGSTDPVAENVDGGRLRLVAFTAGGNRIFVELYVNTSGQLVWRKSSGATGTLA